MKISPSDFSFVSTGQFNSIVQLQRLEMEALILPWGLKEKGWGFEGGSVVQVDGSLLDINCKYRLGRMSELATRKGERTKKVPKHLQYDDADYGAFLSGRTVEQKEKLPNTTENNQIARILQRFVANINQKMRDYHQPDLDRSFNDNQNPPDLEVKKGGLGQNGENTGQKPPGNSTIAGKRGRDVQERAGGQSKIAKSELKKPAQGARSQSAASSSLQPDLQYHTLLNEHIRTAYPNISSISPEMLKGLDIPKQLLESQNGTSKSRPKEDKSKGQQLLRNIKTGKESKEDLKPFKRQSYHVAIAYHIHLKRIKNINPSATEIDPTYPARKLRESQNQSAGKQ